MVDDVPGPLQTCVARAIAALEEALDKALGASNVFTRHLKSTLPQL